MERVQKCYITENEAQSLYLPTYSVRQKILQTVGFEKEQKSERKEQSFQFLPKIRALVIA